ncbi:MAG: Methyl-coenzyme M reductase II subunit beta [Methanomassiliicoccales archaeon PtaU1.Bin124]|nr:MAG: Methyl-coenzyme M reductase II subunit beta [Methanomassiliicoccales archaeon PtaU1.Bin124]
MAKYKDKIDLYDDRGKLIEKDVPLEAISPLYNPAIKRTVSLAKRVTAVDLAALEGGLKKAKVGGGQLKGREMDLAIVANADKIAKRVKDILKTAKDDDTEVSVMSGGKKLLVLAPTTRMDAGVEYTTGFTACASALVQAVIDQFDVDMFQANMVKGAVWGRYPQTLNFQGSIIKSILDVPQLNEGAGFALRNVMANHYVMLTGRNAMNSAALASIFEMAASFEMGDAVGPFERQQLLGLAYQGLNANNMVYEITKENGKSGTIGTVVESLVERALEDKVIKKGKKYPSGFVEMTTNDYPLWNAYAAAGMLAAINVNIGAARAAQGVPATILYYNDLLEHETSLPGVDYGRSMGTSVGMSFFSHSIYGGGGPGLFHGNHVVTKHAKGFVIPVIAAACALDAGTQYFSAENTSPLMKEVLGDIPEFKTPIKVVGKEAKKIKGDF